jgi:eukaryotic-like serine/threonine-protein kinase
MLLMIGKTLGHYRVGEQLGRGGMGEVYLADDTNLNRKVALKFLPDAFTGDPERMSRFEREAKLLASLNHPNIAAIYGLEQAEGTRFLVLELVEGETLAQRLSKGALPIEEALGVCRQIAEGLEAAHEKGVIHRDLKPANVMITEGDKVKILDFGLAKALSDETQSIDSSHSPTITEAMTRPGVILGTAAYMSPEQAKGKSVDKRADIWAFGCILYECLTGKRAFEGETVTETLAAVLTREPDWEKVPAKVRALLRRCMEKDPKKRLRDIGDAYAWLEGTPESAPVKRPWVAWCVAALCLFVAFAFAFVLFREKAPLPSESLRFQIPLPEKSNLVGSGMFSLSPDGRWLAFAATGSDNVSRIWVRPMDSLEARPLPDTEDDGGTPYFWSPDSRFLVFWTGEKLVKIDISGGPRQTLCNHRMLVIGGSWNRDGVIIFGSNTQGVGLMQVSAGGGKPSSLTTPAISRQESSHRFPFFLSDGRHFLYWRASRNPEYDGLYVGSLGAKPEEQSLKRLMEATYGTIYVSSAGSGPGHLLFLHEEILMSQPFDEKRLELAGEAVPMAEGIGSFRDAGYFSASSNGILVYRAGIGDRRVTLLNRRGEVLGTAGEPGDYPTLAFSPDGGRAAVSRGERAEGVRHFILRLFDFARGTNTPLTFSSSVNVSPVWSPDGSRIIFASNRDGVFNLYQKEASGAKDEEPLLKSSDDKLPTSWSSNGSFLLYSAQDSKTEYDLWVLPLEGARKPMPFLRTEFNEVDGHFSPDMRWVAYQSDESGSNEIYIRAFSTNSGAASETGGKWQASVGGGTGPRWRKDGKELYYRAPDGKVMVVEVTAGTVLQPGTPKPLFQAPSTLETFMGIPSPSWDATSDGNQFLLMTPAAEGKQAPFSVVLNWQAGLKK